MTVWQQLNEVWHGVVPDSDAPWLVRAAGWIDEHGQLWVIYRLVHWKFFHGNSWTGKCTAMGGKWL